MASLTEEMMALVKKNLPEYVGVELKSFIDEAEKTKKKLDDALQLLADMRLNTENITTERDNLKVDNKKLTAKIDAVLKLEQELIEKERNLKVTILECQLSGMVAQRDTLVRLTETAFKNPTVRQSLTGSVPVVVEGTPASQYGCGCAGFVVPSAISTVTETTEV